MAFTMLEYYYHGVVAHLGERIAGSDEVASSSLVSSTAVRRMKHSPFFLRFFSDSSKFSEKPVLRECVSSAVLIK